MRQLLLCLLLLFASSLYAQLPHEKADELGELRSAHTPENVINLCEELLESFPGNPKVLNALAEARLDQRQYSQGHQALDQVNQEDVDFDGDVHIEWLRLRGNLYSYQGKGQRSDSVFLLAHDLILKEETRTIEAYRMYSSWAENSFFNGEPMEALHHMEEAGRILEHTGETKEANDARAQFHGNIGVVNWELGNLRTASYHLNQSLELSEEYLAPDDPKINTLLNNLGVLYYHQGNSEKALSYYHLAHQRWLDEFGDSYDRLTLTHNNIARIHGEKKEFEQAMWHINESIRIVYEADDLNSEQAIDALELKARFLREQKKYIQAIDVTDEILQLLEDDRNIESSRVSDVWKTRGRAFAELDSITQALLCFEKAYALLSAERGGNKAKRAECLVYQAQVKRSLGEIDAARELSYQGIDAMLKQDSLPYQISSFEPHRYTVQALAQVGRSEFDQGDISEALRWYNMGMSLLDSLRLSADDLESRQHLSSIAPDLYGGAIESAQKLKMEADELFELFERGKSFSLNLALREINVQQLEGVDPALLQLEEELRNQGRYYKDRLINGDSSQVQEAKEKLYLIERREDSLTNYIQKNLPAYHAWKQHIPIMTLTDIREALGDRVFISYYVYDDQLFALCISEGEMELIEIPCQSLTSLIEDFKQSCGDIEFILNESQSNRQFSSSAFALYNQLIKPLPPFIQEAQSWLVSPHGALHNVNLGILLTEPYDQEVYNFSELAYVFKEKEIGYLWSCSQLSYPERNTSEGFSIWANSGEYEEEMIVGSIDEAKQINDLYAGDFFANAECTEGRFKELASQYSSIHIACHGEAGELYDEFNLRLGSDSLNDGKLTFGELISLQLNADHVVLSACKTGEGKSWKGEAATSVAMGFALAGCPSISMSRWNLNDRSTQLLMTEYYRELQKGVSKTEALQNAQQTYLKTVEDPLLSHPYYWAGFSVYGDPSPIEKKGDNWWWVLAMILLIFPGVGYVAKRSS